MFPGFAPLASCVARQGPCHFVVESCSMFNKDYEVYKDEKGKDNRLSLIHI